MINNEIFSDKGHRQRRRGFFLALILLQISTHFFAQIPDFVVTPNAQCAGASNTTQIGISIPVPNAATYTWSILGGSCSASYTNASVNGSTVIASYPCCGLFTVNCQPYTSGGVPISGAIQSHTVLIQCQTFTAGFSYSQNAQMGINFSNTTINSNTNSPIYTQWNFGDNTSSNVNNPLHNYASTGIYTVTLKDSSGVAPFCASVYQNTVSVCMANFTVPSVVYQGTNALFLGAASPSNASSPFYYWYSSGLPPVVQGSAALTATMTYSTLGVQSMTFGFSTAAPFCSVATTQTFNVVNPCGNLTYTQGTNGQVVLFAPTNSISGSTYTWSPGGSTGSQPTTSITYTSNGQYTVNMVMNNSLCPSYNSSVLVNVTSFTTGCSLVSSYTWALTNTVGVVGFTNTTAMGAGATYTWSFGDNTSSVGPSGIFHTYPQNGTYLATLTVNNNTIPTCTSTAVQTIFVNSYTTPCNLSVGFTSTQGTNGAVNFINTSSGLLPGATYTWYFGVGSSTSNVASPSFTYPANGVFSVSLVVNNNSSPACFSVDSHTIAVNSIPLCSLTANFIPNIGANGQVNFINATTNTAATTSYTWDFGDTSSSIVTSPTHTYSTNGSYTVTLVASNNSIPACTSTATATVTVSNIPSPCTLTAGFIFQNNAPGQVMFTNTSLGTTSTSTYSWNFGNGGSSTAASPIITYTAAGPYPVSLTVTDGLCVSSFTAMVTPCMLSVSYAYSIGSNGLVTFTSTSLGTYTNSTYAWLFGDGQSGTGLITSHTYSINATYHCTLQVAMNNTAQTCSWNSSTDTLIVNTIPGPCNVSAGFSHLMGSGGTVNFTNLSSGTGSNTTYFWDFGDGYFSTSFSPVHTYSNGGTHYVRLKTVVNSNCMDSTIVALNVTGVSCSANSGFTLLPSGTPKLWIAVPAYPWNVSNALWQWGDGSSDTTLYTSHLYSVSANYNICLTVTVSCGATATTCSSYLVYKSSSEQAKDIIGINVLKPDLVLTTLADLENNEVFFDILPNPNKGSFIIRAEHLSGNQAEVYVYDPMGRVVFHRQNDLEGGELHSAIELENISNGFFFIRINAGNQQINRKVVVNK